MQELRGYSVQEEIYASEHTRILRARRHKDAASVIIKIPSTDYPSLKHIARVRHEHDTLRRLDHPAVIRAYSIERSDNLVFLTLEDFGGIPIKEHFASGGVPLDEFLRLAIAMATGLSVVHSHNIIHKDLNPRNILVNPGTKQIKIIDFGIATHLSREVQQIRSPDRLEGTLAYMSPEQTGRINRALDYRTDLYSLGATLYELLSGAPPFSGKDAMELVHCHIAKDPPPLDGDRVPQAISDILAKLMAKTPEERYQGALGVKADLEECLRQLQHERSIRAFALAQQDVSQKFEIPQKLYGRTAETSLLLDAFGRAARGATELLLVSGYSGIGKSALINEIHRPIFKQRGYFIAGKYDQYNRDVPCSAITQAFTEMIHHILKEPEHHVAAWKTQIQRALGSNGQVVLDVIPALALLIGPQPAVPAMPAADAQHRFHVVFQDFVRALATAEHPLALFLDDLQWADASSFNLLNVLVTHAKTQHLFVIAAYRSNEVSDSHPCVLMIQEIKSTGCAVNEVSLEPLRLADIVALLADTLRRAPDRVLSLAELLLEKTGGNPFFLVQLLRSLHEDSLVAMNAAAGVWEWNIDRIREIGITDNVVDLMTRKIERLPEDTREALKLAACVGNTFDCSILSIVHEETNQATAAHLWPALREGLVVPLSETYTIFHDEGLDHGRSPRDAAGEVDVRRLISDKVEQEASAGRLEVKYRFLHDRVQQATYALIPASQRSAEHLKIGRLLLRSTSPERLEDDLFDIVSHLNAGIDRIDDAGERAELSELNYRAGKKAKASTAYGTAASHFATAMQLLPGDFWSRHYALALDLHRDRAACEYLLGNFDASSQLIADAIAHASSILDTADMYVTQMQLCTTEGSDYAKAIQVGLDALALFDYRLPTVEEEKIAAVEAETRKLERLLEQIGTSQLYDVPPMTDPEKLAVMKLLVFFISPTYLGADTHLYTLASLLLFSIPLEHGHCADSAYGCLLYGMILVGKEEYQRAHEFGQLAERLNERYPNVSTKGKIWTMRAHGLNPYVNHLDTNLTQYRVAYEACLQVGDLNNYAIWIVMYMVWTRFMKGDPLKDVFDDSERYITFAEQTNDRNIYLSIELFRRVVQCLRGLTSSSRSLDWNGFDEANVLGLFHKNKCAVAVHWHATLKAIVHFMFERHEDALAMISVAEETIGSNFGFFSTTNHYFYASLVMAALYPRASKAVQAEHLALIERNAKKVQSWAESCPANFLHRRLLIEAELARIQHDPARAAELYDRSIDHAVESGFTHDQALASELAAKFYLGMGRMRLARVYMAEAHYAYGRWGADAKVAHLNETYPNLLSSSPSGPARRAQAGLAPGLPSQTSTSTVDDVNEALDLMTVLKASQAVSGEIVLSRLLETLMRIALQNAGADKGYLLLDAGGELFVEVRASEGGQRTEVLQSTPVDDLKDLSQGIVRYVQRTMDSVVLANAEAEGSFVTDVHVLEMRSKSILCLPILNHGKLIGIFYLENGRTKGAFTPARVSVLQILSSQAAISIENSQLYGSLEEKVRERTAELREAQDRLVRLEREATEKRMAGGFAHEIRNALSGAHIVAARMLGRIDGGQYESMPLAAANALLEHYEAIQRYLPESEQDVEIDRLRAVVEAQEYIHSAVQLIVSGLRRALSITTTILDYSTIEERARIPHRTAAGAVLYEVVAEAKRAFADQAIAFEVAVARNAAVRVDAALWRFVLESLVTNACHAIRDRGSAGQEGRVSVEVSVEGPQCVVRVEDDGGGIPSDQVDRIFDAFYTTRGAEGVGLGLAMVKRIVDANEGTISVRSEWQKGTQFTVTLPAAEDVGAAVEEVYHA